MFTLTNHRKNVHLVWSWVCFLFGIAQDQSWMKAKKKRTVAELAAGNADVGHMLGRMPPQDSPCSAATRAGAACCGAACCDICPACWACGNCATCCDTCRACCGTCPACSGTCTACCDTSPPHLSMLWPRWCRCLSILVKLPMCLKKLWHLSVVIAVRLRSELGTAPVGSSEDHLHRNMADRKVSGYKRSQQFKPQNASTLECKLPSSGSMAKIQVNPWTAEAFNPRIGAQVNRTNDYKKESPYLQACPAPFVIDCMIKMTSACSSSKAGKRRLSQLTATNPWQSSSLSKQGEARYSAT